MRARWEHGACGRAGVCSKTNGGVGMGWKMWNRFSEAFAGDSLLSKEVTRGILFAWGLLFISEAHVDDKIGLLCS